MVSVTSMVLALCCCLLVIVSLPATPADAQAHTSYRQVAFRGPRYRSSWWAQPRSLWSQARSIMPRLATVATDTFAYLALPAFAVFAISALWPEHQHYRIRREANGTETVVKEGLTEHLVGVYQTALESEECMQRLACKLGAATSSLRQRHKGLVHRLVSSMTTSKFSDLYNKFSSGVDAETCATYSCSKMKKL
ncbi:uncharacterized protein [Cherax quadricarinatus]|uniref:uncharacterized protein n=1 Tax=Cherax quadricarinatus TaxID=27406 RepID=UPI002377F870|nr:uncharacterized protein LOC128689650 [Cherax quadricarinatus]